MERADEIGTEPAASIYTDETTTTTTSVIHEESGTETMIETVHDEETMIENIVTGQIGTGEAATETKMVIEGVIDDLVHLGVMQTGNE